jgi:4-hydroxy-tetrahydrodipicolinate synthase
MTEPGAIRGVYNILPTPFDESGAVDEASLRRLVDFVIGTDVDGLTILGFLGEAAKLSEAERVLVIDVSLEATAGRVPVIVGATAQPPTRVSGMRAMPSHAAPPACSWRLRA